MLENFVVAFIVYFVVIDPVGNAPIFLAITSHLPKRQKIRVAIEGSSVAAAIMFFRALLGMDPALSGDFLYRFINWPVVLFHYLLPLICSATADNNVKNKEAISPRKMIFLLAIPLLTGPAAIIL